MRPIAKLLAICSNFIYLDENIFSLEYGQITRSGTYEITIPLSNPKQYFWAIDINNYTGVYNSQEGAINTLSLPFNIVEGWSRQGFITYIHNSTLAHSLGATLYYSAKLSSRSIVINLSNNYSRCKFWSSSTYYWAAITCDNALS